MEFRLLQAWMGRFSAPAPSCHHGLRHGVNRVKVRRTFADLAGWRYTEAGSLYISIRFTQRLAEAGAASSVGRQGGQ
jgi:hypothetical protein